MRIRDFLRKKGRAESPTPKDIDQRLYNILIKSPGADGKISAEDMAYVMSLSLEQLLTGRAETSQGNLSVLYLAAKQGKREIVGHILGGVLMASGVEEDSELKTELEKALRESDLSGNNILHNLSIVKVKDKKLNANNIDIMQLIMHTAKALGMDDYISQTTTEVYEMTPLHIAVRYGNTPVIQVLLENGADVLLATKASGDDELKTPLDVVGKSNDWEENIETYSFLLRHSPEARAHLKNRFGGFTVDVEALSQVKVDAKHSLLDYLLSIEMQERIENRAAQLVSLYLWYTAITGEAAKGNEHLLISATNLINFQDALEFTRDPSQSSEEFVKKSMEKIKDLFSSFPNLEFDAKKFETLQNNLLVIKEKIDAYDITDPKMIQDIMRADLLLVTSYTAESQLEIFNIYSKFIDTNPSLALKGLEKIDADLLFTLPGLALAYVKNRLECAVKSFSGKFNSKEEFLAKLSEMTSTREISELVEKLTMNPFLKDDLKNIIRTVNPAAVLSPRSTQSMFATKSRSGSTSSIDTMSGPERNTPSTNSPSDSEENSPRNKK